MITVHVTPLIDGTELIEIPKSSYNRETRIASLLAGTVRDWTDVHQIAWRDAESLDLHPTQIGGFIAYLKALVSFGAPLAR